MQQIDTIQLAPKVPTFFNRVTHLFAGFRPSIPQSERVQFNIDWPDSDSEQPFCESHDQPISGGYNEAFIVQNWTSYHLK